MSNANPAACDAVVVGSGPNGLAAAITIARAGYSVTVLEAAATIGGGLRTADLTLPGFRHDRCAAVLPLTLASPFFQSVPLRQTGVEWVWPLASVAHPLDDGTAAVLYPSIDATCTTLGLDAAAYRRLMAPLVADSAKIMHDLLGPLRVPRYPLAFARFGRFAIWSAQRLARGLFRGPHARALLAGLAGHSMLSLDQAFTAGFALTLGILGHSVGWPLARGGSNVVADGLVRFLASLGGTVRTDSRVATTADLPSSSVSLFDVTPRQLLGIAGNHFSPGYREQLARYRYGPGAFKLDWALASPIPWRASACEQAGTVHLGGTLEEIVASEAMVTRGENPTRPFVILVQPTLFDPSRAPAGLHTAWAYCHVPNGSTFDMTQRIEDQVERFAPGFRERIIGRHVMSPLAFERYDANYVGGDINGGLQDFRQLFTRPVPRLNPYTTTDPDYFICSSATPPGGGVQGMNGYFAAKSALARLKRARRPRGPA